MKSSNINFAVAIFNTIFGILIMLGGSTAYVQMACAAISLAIGLVCRYTFEGHELPSFNKKPELTYDQRWDDPEYVAMIHRTRAEEESFNIPLTECLCGECNKPKEIRSERVAIPERVSWASSTEIEDYKKRQRLVWVKNYAFYLHHYVPVNAQPYMKEWQGAEDGLIYCTFKWFNTAGREVRYMAVTSEATQREIKAQNMHRANKPTPITNASGRLSIDDIDYDDGGFIIRDGSGRPIFEHRSYE